MEVISIDGVEYVRAAVLARKYKYTSDYIGQLCRASKVEAKLVGRTWYVSPDSLEQHQKARYQKDSADEKTRKNSTLNKSSRINVEAVQRSDTVKSINNFRQNSPQYLRRIEWKPVKYEADQSELLPPLKQGSVSVSLPVDAAEAESLRIKESSTPINLEAEPLPEVSLRGVISIHNAEDNFLGDDNTQENIDISLDSEDDTVLIHPKSKDRRTLIRIVTDDSEALELAEEQSQPKVKAANEPYTYDVPVTVTDRASFTPRSVKKKVAAQTLEIKPNETKKSRHTQSIVLVLLAVGGVVLGGLMLSLEKVTTATMLGQSSEWGFSLLIQFFE